ncbi:MAG: hypothetical protein AB9866_21575 [Syntrophobacteraceae bacterium]
MKRIFAVSAICLAICIALCLPAFAVDKLITTKVSSIKVANDKNGTEYVRLMVDSPSTVSGVSYVTATPAMAFGAHAAKAKTLKAGQVVKMIVAERDYQGRPSYTILKFVE